MLLTSPTVMLSMQSSDHPFTFLWLLGLIQQYAHRCPLHKLDDRTQREVI